MTSNSISIKSFDILPNLVIGPKSHFSDRIQSEIEYIYLPHKASLSGTFNFHLSESTTKAGNSNFVSRLLNKNAETLEIPNHYIFEFRHHWPNNWAHILNNHLPCLFFICKNLSLELSNVVVALPKNTASYIVSAINFFDIKTVCTDQKISGTIVNFDATPWVSIRSVRHNWASGNTINTIISKQIESASKYSPPSKIYLSRKDTRTVENEKELTAFLAKHSYSVVYPEELTVAEQFKLFYCSSDIVAIHGAGLAPLLYVDAHENRRNIYEIIPCGHATDVYRLMAQQKGWNWIGIRGKVKPEYISGAYDETEIFDQYSFDSFEVDIDAVEASLNLIDKTLHHL